MKRVEVRLSIAAVAPLLDLIKAVADELRVHVAVPVALVGSDVDFAEVWREELLKSQREDCDRLFSLFDQEFFSDGVVAFDRNNAEAVLRACAALRLRFRGTHLKKTPTRNWRRWRPAATWTGSTKPGKRPSPASFFWMSCKKSS